jgi:phenylacetate-CoA ligase
MTAEGGVFGDEYAGRAELASWQAEKLRRLLPRLRREVPYYRSCLEAAGIDAGQICVPGDVAKLPLMSKSTLRDEGPDLYVTEDIVDFVSSSGTAGKPVILPVTREEEPLRVHPISRVLRELGLGPGDRVLHNFNMFALYVFGYYSALAVREVGCALVRMGPVMEERQVDILRELRPTAFIANPFFMVTLAETARRLGYDPSSSPLKKGLLATATPFGPDLQPTEMRRSLESAWDLELTIAHYGSSEIGPIAYECRRHRGYHVHEDVLYVERLDPQTLQPVAPDQPGELVVTHLDGGRGLTAVRYRTGDLVAWSTDEPCECGRRTMRLGPVVGRVDQQVKLRGQNVTPDFLLALIDPVEGVGVAVIEAFRQPETGEDWLRVKVGAEDLGVAAQLREAVRAKIAAHIPTAIPIEVVPKENVVRQQQEAAARSGGNKVVRFFDLR